MKQVRKGAMPEELERERLASTTRLWELAIIGLVTALCIASTALPLYVVYLMVKALAEKSTHILAAISYTSAGLVGASSGSAVLVGGLAKYRSQRKELIRLRERCAQLEGRLKRKGRK